MYRKRLSCRRHSLKVVPLKNSLLEFLFSLKGNPFKEFLTCLDLASLKEVPLKKVLLSF